MTPTCRLAAGLAGRPTADYERIILERDPIARYSLNVLVNFSRPVLSPLLLAPLAKTAGGWGTCPEVFGSTNDPDYQRLLTALGRGKEQLDQEPRYGTADFRPNRQYLRELQRFGILAVAPESAEEPRNVFDTDQAYWRALWPEGPGRPRGSR